MAPGLRKVDFLGISTGPTFLREFTGSPFYRFLRYKKTASGSISGPLVRSKLMGATFPGIPHPPPFLQKFAGVQFSVSYDIRGRKCVHFWTIFAGGCEKRAAWKSQSSTFLQKYPRNPVLSTLTASSFGPPVAIATRKSGFHGNPHAPTRLQEFKAGPVLASLTI